MADYNVNPYWDTTEEEFQKNYKRVLAYPGRNPQARELTVIQGLTLKHLENLARSLFDDGQIIEGCEAIVSGTTVTITAGKIYAGGLIHSVPETNVTITGTGTEIIGLKITEEIITEDDDSTLRDPAQGYENYDHPGMHRIKTVLNFVVNDSTAIPLYTIVDGVLQSSTTTSSNIYSILAERTFDESGNYRVYGLNTTYNKDIDTDTIEIRISPGKAYIQGWQVLVPSNQFIEISKSKDTRETLNEPHTYHAGTDTYKLIHQPVASVETVTATVQVGSGGSTGEAIVKGVPDSADPIGYDSVTEIVEVWDATHGTYIQGTDYILSNNSVDWSPAGAEPAQGDTYYVTFKYLKNMEEGTDFQVTTIDDEQYIDFSIGGDNPVDNTVFMVDYLWYLARIDVVHIDRDGNISVIAGKPDTTISVRAPDYYYATLPLAQIYLPPNSSDIEVTEYNNYRLTMDDLHTLYKRVTQNEFDIAELDLEKQALKQESSIYLRGIFTDNFLGVDKADIGSVDFTACIDLRWNWLTLQSTENVNFAEVNITNTTATISNNYVYIPYTSETAIQQSYASETININPYATFGKEGLITLNPAHYTWTDTEYIDKYLGTQYTTKRVWTYRTSHITFHTRRNVVYYQRRFYHNNDIISQNDTLESVTQTLERNQIVSIKKVAERYDTDVPSFTVQIEGKNFLPNSDNLTLYVNNKQMALTPTGSTPAGTNPGTIKSLSDGTFTAKFTIPAGTPAGLINIKIENDDNRAYSVLLADRIIKIYEQDRVDIQTTVEHWLRTTVRARFTPPASSPNPVDPIAQTFSFDEDTFITKIKLYFKSKSSSVPIILQIRDVVNGYPGNNVLYRQLIEPADINVSDDSSVATEITLDYPVLCLADKEYALTLLTDSTDYNIWIAKGGGTDILTNSFIGTQPYTAGVLFASSNNTAWSAMQDTDLKFEIEKAVFTKDTDYYLYFNELTGLSNFSRFQFNTLPVSLLNTELKWQYSIDSGVTWTNFTANDPFETDIESITNRILIRAILRTSDENVSPIINIDGTTLVTFIYDSTGDYLTNTIDTTQTPYSDVKIEYEAWLPSGTTVTPYFSDDEAATWKSLTLDNSYQVNGKFWKYSYSAKLMADPPNVSETNATIDSTAGSLADSTTYYYIFTGTNSEGETTGCTEFSVEVNTGSATNSIVFDLTNAFDEHTTGFKVYRSTASGSETLKYIVSGTPTSWIDDGSDTDASTDVPPTNNTAYYTADNLKMKLTLTTANQAYTPRVRDFVGVFKETL